MTLDCAIGLVLQIVLFFPISLPVTVYDLMNGEQLCYHDERITDNGKLPPQELAQAQQEQAYSRLPKRIR